MKIFNRENESPVMYIQIKNLKAILSAEDRIPRQLIKKIQKLNIDNYSETLPDEAFFERLQISLRYDIVVEKIKGLDERYSITMLLYYCEGMDVKAISKAMGISEKTVYTRLERGKRLLLEEVSKEGAI